MLIYGICVLSSNLLTTITIMAFATGKSVSDRMYRTNADCIIVSADGLKMVIDDDLVCSLPHLLVSFICICKTASLITIFQASHIVRCTLIVSLLVPRSLPGALWCPLGLWRDAYHRPHWPQQCLFTWAFQSRKSSSGVGSAVYSSNYLLEFWVEVAVSDLV